MNNKLSPLEAYLSQQERTQDMRPTPAVNYNTGVMYGPTKPLNFDEILRSGTLGGGITKFGTKYDPQTNAARGTTANSTAAAMVKSFDPTAFTGAPAPQADTMDTTGGYQTDQPVGEGFGASQYTGTGGSDTGVYSNEQVADVFNTMNGKPTTYNQPTDLFEQYFNDRFQGKGLYAIDPSKQYSPDQIATIRNSADKYYETRLGQEAKRQIADLTTSNSGLDSSVVSKSKWLEGLYTQGLVPGATQDERQNNLKYLATLPEETLKAKAATAVYNKLKGTEKQAFDAAESNVGMINSILTTAPADFRNNPYKYQAQKYSAFVGGTGDQRYKDYVSRIGLVKAPIINQLYGAAVTGSEYGRAIEFIPALESDSVATTMTKLRNLAAFYEFANDALVARSLGVEKPLLDDYLAKYDNAGGTDTGPAKITPKGGISF
jgi:hypothetical protein